ncbi:MAG: putative baseplate assembly protein [Xanthomonadales bacterium]|nr:putative baseplate assembly protein [Xanthomonadales bacterium]
MSRVWWGKESSPRDMPRMARGHRPGVEQPVLHAPDGADILAELIDRVMAYTPEWTNLRTEDAGYALAALFSELAEPVVQRLNRLPHKDLVEFLRSAGVTALPAQPARAMLVFSASEAADGSILVPRGFQASAPAADGSGDTVTFETERSMQAAPLTLDSTVRKTGTLFEEIQIAAPGEDAGTGFLPFGTRPRVGAAFLLEFTGNVAPRPSISIGVIALGQSGAPAPVAAGETVETTPGPSPLLRWEVLDGTSFEEAAVLRDETQGLTQTGVVELKLPERWRTGIPSGMDTQDPGYWLRVTLVHGEYQIDPRLRSVHLNAVTAQAVRTVREEVLEYVPGSDRRRMRLTQTPILPGSLQLVVDEGGVSGDSEVVWSETPSLALHGSADRVYTLDAENGELEFGDGINGAILPGGFRHVVALQYQVGGGDAGRVGPETITTLVQSVPFLTEVSNPLAATGGRDSESLDESLRRGPEQIRSRGRAVTVADFALLARQAPGADVRRAHAIGAQDARFPGAAVPGTVTVLLVSSDQGEEPPIPAAGTLQAVAEYLSAEVAPAGTQIVAAAPSFQRVALQASVSVDPRMDTGTVIQAALDQIQTYLHPLSGGEDGEGWPFGGVIRYQALVRMLLDRVSGLRAVVSANLSIDGVVKTRCQDIPIHCNGLLWPGGHEIVPVSEVSS